MIFIFYLILAHKVTGAYLEERNFWTWLEDYWWVIALALIAIGSIAFWIYKQQTRLHKITLFAGRETTVVEVQHGKTFSAPIPDTEGTFKGWYRDSACTIPFNSSDKIVSDFSLYSKFE